MDVLLPAAGALVVFAALQDIFYTVLFPASGHGILRKPIADAIWYGFKLVGRTTSGARRRNLLSYAGPTLIALTLATWIGLLVVGWAMIYKPALGTGIRLSNEPTDTSWSTALYFSGYCLTTLGIGDVTAMTAVYRLLAVAEAAVGFGTFSMVITYFLSVYSVLTDRNAFAQGLHHLTGATGDAVELLVRLAAETDLSRARGHLSKKADFLRRTHQTHRFYPVLRYFHYREPQYALPRVLLTALDTATLVRSALDESRYGGAIRSTEIDELVRAAMDLMGELVPGVKAEPPSREDVEAWTERFRQARARLAEGGLTVRKDEELGVRGYVEMRSRWNEPLAKLEQSMLYEGVP